MKYCVITATDTWNGRAVSDVVFGPYNKNKLEAVLRKLAEELGLDRDDRSFDWDYRICSEDYESELDKRREAYACTAYILPWDDAEKILLEITGKKYVLQNSSDSGEFYATVGEDEMDEMKASEIDEIFSEYFGKKLVGWANPNGIILI